MDPIEDESFEDEPLYPRVLGNRLPFNNENVTVVGMITLLDQSERKLYLEVDAVTKKTLHISIPITEPAELRQVKFLEVRGVSRDDGTIQMRDYSNFQDGFDLKAYNEVIKLTSESSFKPMFGF